MTPPAWLKPAAYATVLAIAGAISYGLLTRGHGYEVSPDGHSVVVHWSETGDDSPTCDAGCWCLGGSVARAQPAALALFGLISDAGPQYVCLERVCSEEPSGAVAASLPSSMVALDDSASTAWRYDGGPRMVAGLLGSDSCPCACNPAADSGCESLGAALDGPEAWGPAPLRQNLGAGRWRGACVRVACVAGNSWPDPVDLGCP